MAKEGKEWELTRMNKKELERNEICHHKVSPNQNVSGQNATRTKCHLTVKNIYTMLMIANWWWLLKLVWGSRGRTSVNIWTTNLDAKRRNIWNRQHNGAYVMFSHQLNDNLRRDSKTKCWEKVFNSAVIQCIGIVDNWELSSFPSNRIHLKLFCLPACLL